MTPGLPGKLKQLQWLMGRVLFGNSREDKSHRAPPTCKVRTPATLLGLGNVSFLSAGFIMLLDV